jgi:hypothetical protein
MMFALALVGVATIVSLIALMKVFSKAGRPAILALVPVVNILVYLKILRYSAGLSFFVLVGLFLPAGMYAVWLMGPEIGLDGFSTAAIVAVLFIGYVLVLEQVLLRTARVFGKDDSFAWGLLLFPFIYYSILGFGKATYSPDLPTDREKTYLPKIGVVAYGVLALMCLMTAVAVYTQRMNFVLPKGETTKGAMTRVDQAIATTKTLRIANNRALSRWIDEADEVVRLEADHVLRRDFYRGQIELVRTGQLDGMDVKDPVRQLAREAASGTLKLDATDAERPPVKVGRAQENALPQSVYKEGLEKAKQENKRLQEEINADDAAATKAGLAINGDANNKGLRTRIVEQTRIAQDAEAETLYLEDFITNRRADAQLFVKRRDALQASIDRLARFYQKKPGTGGN